MCFVGGNFPFNLRLSTVTNIPIVGCHSHKLNFATEDWIECQPGLAMAREHVSELMSQNRTIDNFAQLRRLTTVGTVLASEIR